jgi:hypothetical protein
MIGSSVNVKRCYMGSIGYGPYIVTVRVSYALFSVFIYEPSFPPEIALWPQPWKAPTQAHIRARERTMNAYG